MRRTISIISIGIALAAFQAQVCQAETVKRQDLPANLKGGKVSKNSDGIPGCATGREKLSGKDLDSEPIASWRATHDKHPCADAGTLWVCRVGKNLSVRCE